MKLHFPQFKHLLILIFILFFGITQINLTNSETINPTLEFEFEGSKNVLFISAYSSGYYSFFDQIDGIRDRFKGYPITLDIEFMDSKRFFTDENLKNFHDSLSYKMSQIPKYDAIMLSDDNALNFVIQYRDELFKDIPIVFLGINNVQNALTYSQDDLITGLIESLSLGDTIQMAYDLNPSAENVYGLTDNTPSGQGVAQAFLDEQSRFPNLNFKLIDLSKITFDEFPAALNHLGDHDLVILLSAIRDIHETTISFDQGVDLITQNSSQPVYHHNTQGVGNGLIGGKVISIYDQGYGAAEMVLKYFSGTSIKDIPLKDQSFNKYVIDYPTFEKYNFDLARLPVDTILLNKKISLIERYFMPILVTLILITIETFIILFLILNIRSRHQIQHELLTTNEELTAIIDELSSTNDHLKNTLETIEKKDSEIHDLLYLDLLTGLRNRFSISEHIKLSIQSDQVTSLAIIFLDVDNFKIINDTFGHDIGDQVISQTGKRLKKFCSDTVAIGRFGGDEFLISVDYKEDLIVLEKLIEAVNNSFKSLMVIDNNQFFLTVSIGVANYPHHGHSIDDLIKKADIALYRAKNTGKNKFIIYDELMNTSIKDKLSFQNLLRQAFENNEFYMNYQPIINTTSMSVVGYEALIRWYDPTIGQVSPHRLITEAEELGLIISIGKWVIHEACKFAKTLASKFGATPYVSINISSVQLMYTGFYEDLTDCVLTYGVKPQNICLEMTETILIQNMDLGGSTVDKLHEYGFKISLDDFGTGYSSLSYLKNLTIDTLKIDKSFIDSINKSTYDQYLIEAIIKIAKQRQIIVIAEGVETQNQLKTLNQLNCNMIQGYYFSKPLSDLDAAEFGNALNKH